MYSPYYIAFFLFLLKYVGLVYSHYLDLKFFWLLFLLTLTYCALYNMHICNHEENSRENKFSDSHTKQKFLAILEILEIYYHSFLIKIYN